MILPEGDFEGLGEMETRKLFVESKGAKMQLIVVASERAKGSDDREVMAPRQVPIQAPDRDRVPGSIAA